MIRLPLEEVKRALANPEKHFTTLTNLYPLSNERGDMRCFERSGRLVVEMGYADQVIVLECLLRNVEAANEVGSRLQSVNGRLWLATCLLPQELMVYYPQGQCLSIDVLLFESFVEKSSSDIVCSYDWTGRLSEGLLCVMRDQHWGYINRAGEEVIPLRYDWADDFTAGQAVVLLDNCYGLIDAQGAVTLPIRYEDVEWDATARIVRVTDNGEVTERRIP